ASANKKKYTKEIVEQEARTYQEKLEEEINVRHVRLQPYPDKIRKKPTC
ncbi:MAG: Transposase IS4 family protein, partial [Caldanaerobacter subterraneus]